MPHFTEDSLQRIIINPFYAITVAESLTEEHEPSMGEAEWVQANASLMEQMGSAWWLRQLLDVLEGKAPAPQGADRPIPGHQHRPAVRRRASSAHRQGDVGGGERHTNTQHGGGGLAPTTTGCARGRHRDG